MVMIDPLGNHVDFLTFKQLIIILIKLLKMRDQ